MNSDPRRRDREGDRILKERQKERQNSPTRIRYSQFGFYVKNDNQTPRIGCGLLLLVVGVWLLLWIFDIIELDPRYIWIPFAIVLIALGLRLLFATRR